MRATARANAATTSRKENRTSARAKEECSLLDSASYVQSILQNAKFDIVVK